MKDRIYSIEAKVRLVIAGCRDFEDETKFNSVMDGLYLTLSKEYQYPSIHIIEGACRGTDTLARKWAIKHETPFTEVPADFNRYNKFAGPLRNKIMIDLGTHLLAFWDGKSRGTKNIIAYAQSNPEYNGKIIIININDI